MSRPSKEDRTRSLWGRPPGPSPAYPTFPAGSTLNDHPKVPAGVLDMSLFRLGLFFVVDSLHRLLCPRQSAG
jgi:hypothetical protein